MRDIIWTIILVWLVWRIYEAFKGVSKMQAQRMNSRQNQYSQGSQHNYQQQNRRKEGEVRVDSAQSAHKPHFKPGDGEYVDYEEIKP